MKRSSSAWIAVHLVVFGTSALAACGSEGSNRQAASVAPTEAKPAAVAVLAPGQWMVSPMSANLEYGSGASPGTAIPTFSPITTLRCLTSDQAATPDANFLTGHGDDAGCAYDDISLRGGRIRGNVSCNSLGVRIHVALDGQYTANRYNLMMRGEAA